jgi:hypothetical protein
LVGGDRFRIGGLIDLSASEIERRRRVALEEALAAIG